MWDEKYLENNGAAGFKVKLTIKEAAGYNT